MRRKVVKAILGLCSVALLGATIQGCSVSRALSGPPPVAVDKVKVGENRNNIISVLGIPKNTENKPDGKIDMHEFIDGYSNGSKVRVILYIAGDFFTLGLSELLFWPIELAAGDGTKGRAIVTYGMDDISKSVLLTKADGSAWEYAAPEVTPQPKKNTSRVDPVTGSIIQD